MSKDAKMAERHDVATDTSRCAGCGSSTFVTRAGNCCEKCFAAAVENALAEIVRLARGHRDGNVELEVIYLRALAVGEQLFPQNDNAVRVLVSQLSGSESKGAPLDHE